MSLIAPVRNRRLQNIITGVVLALACGWGHVRKYTLQYMTLDQ